MARTGSIPKDCLRLFRDPQRLAFLAGSGVSAASGLPTGWAFNEGLAEFLSVDRLTESHARALFITGPNITSGAALRFEHALQLLRDSVDPELHVLDVFERSSTPTYLHNFLASMLLRGAEVLTTNFDSLIEHAFLSIPRRRNVKFVQVAQPTGRAGRRVASFSSFRHAPRKSVRALYKLHGTLRDLSFSRGRVGKRYTDSLSVTLDTIVNKQGPFRLDPSRAAVLARCLRGRVVVLLGYSGLDDFDIVPELLAAARNASALVYFKHRRAGPIRAHAIHNPATARILPASLRSAYTCGAPVWVISGPTPLTVQAITGVPYVSAQIPTLSVVSMLRRIPPYQHLTGLDKRTMLARMLEGASRSDAAITLYRECIRAASPSEKRSETWATCQNNLGNLLRQRGEIEEAKQHLRIAIRRYGALGRQVQLGSAKNNLALCLQAEGKWSHARRYYTEALSVFKDSPKRAARTTLNLCAIARRSGDYGEAVKRGKEAVRLAQRARDPHALALSWGNLGNAYLSIDARAAAQDAYNKALRLARKTGDTVAVANQLNNLAFILRTRRQLKRGRALLAESIEINQKLRRRDALVDNFTNEGQYAECAGDSALASKKYNRAIQLGERIGYSAGAAEAMILLGQLRISRGETLRGRPLLTKAARALRTSGAVARAREIESQARRQGKSSRATKAPKVVPVWRGRPRHR